MVSSRLPATASAVDAKQSLDEHGYLIIENLQPRSVMERLLIDLKRYDAQEEILKDEFFGGALRKVEEVVNKSPAFVELLDTPLVSAIAAEVLGENPLLHATGVFILEQGGYGQTLHQDEVIYKPYLPRTPGGPQYVLNMMWAVVDFTAENGGTRILPGSHLWTDDRTPQEGDKEIQIEMSAGSLGMWLGSVWHGGGINRTPAARVGAEMGFNCGWLRPYESQLLLVPPLTAKDLPERVAAMAGYQAFKGVIGRTGRSNPMEMLKALQGRSLDMDSSSTYSKVVPLEVENVARDYIARKGKQAPTEIEEALGRLAKVNKEYETANGVDRAYLSITARSIARELSDRLRRNG